MCVCVRGIVGTTGGYSGSSWITRPRVTQARAQLVVDSARHIKKKGTIIGLFLHHPNASLNVERRSYETRFEMIFLFICRTNSSHILTLHKSFPKSQYHFHLISLFFLLFINKSKDFEGNIIKILIVYLNDTWHIIKQQ
jgi:hypothetical protein